jgi:perosamine synthetase
MPSMTYKIPFSAPNIGQLEKEYANKAIDSTWISGQGEFIDKFEAKFAKYIGVKYAVACSSGTTALHLAYLCCGMRNVSKVAISKDTFIATKNMAALMTKEVTLLDGESDTWTIKCPDTTDQDFIVGVHLYGNPCDMGQAYRAKYIFIEDCAQSLGSTYRGRKCGRYGLASIFSFHSSKLITTGEGGMICTDDENVAKQARFARNQSMIKPYQHPYIGFNYRMTNIQAAIGLAQLERIDELIKAKKRMSEYYDEMLDESFVRQIPTKHSNIVPWAKAYKHDQASNIRVKLEEVGIETRPGFVDDKTIVFPCSTNLTKEDIEYVVRQANDFCKN